MRKKDLLIEKRLRTLKKKILPILIKHKVFRAGIFGSYVKGKTTRKSDIDILVEFRSKKSLLDFVALKLELERKLKRKVDLVEYSCIHPLLKESILREEVRIYI